MWDNAYEEEGVKRSGQKFVMNGEDVQYVAEYKYLGCMLNEQMESRVMVEARARARARVMCAWLKKCRVSVEEVQGWTFVKLMEAMVDMVLLYGAKV